MKDLTTSVYTFDDLICGNFLYVDKTEYLWKLIAPEKAMYFLSRPRRFGKSLTVSTLKAIFQGKKDLFKGLAIYDKPYDWKKYPVIHWDMGNCAVHSPDELRNFFAGKLLDAVEENHLELEIDPGQLSTSFSRLIRAVSKENPVVVLLDEYDKPLLENLSSPDADKIRDIMSDLYSTLKTENANERFVFITGVSKFCHVSLFSKLNNLQDITMNADYATMLGYTQEEFEANFTPWIEKFEAKQDLPHDQYLAEIKRWYDGFRFNYKAESVYNPVSLASFFLNNAEFNNYWFSTGTPSFLMHLAKKTDFDFENILTNPVSEDAFYAYEIEKIDPLVLLVQTGYLTIKDSFTEFGVRQYHLGFPNREVSTSFKKYLLKAYTPYSSDQIASQIMDLARSVSKGDVDKFMNIWKNWMAKIPYDIQLRHEKYYQTIFYMMFISLKGIISEAECQTNRGRIDAVLGYGEWLYIIEFKLDKTPGQALEQIKANKYFEKYLLMDRRIVLIGANVDFENRDLTDWVFEELKHA